MSSESEKTHKARIHDKVTAIYTSRNRGGTSRIESITVWGRGGNVVKYTTNPDNQNPPIDIKVVKLDRFQVNHQLIYFRIMDQKEEFRVFRKPLKEIKNVVVKISPLPRMDRRRSFLQEAATFAGFSNTNISPEVRDLSVEVSQNGGIKSSYLTNKDSFIFDATTIPTVASN